MNLSYWEIKSWFSEVDYAVVGSGIVGLHTAIYLQERKPSAKIIVLEKGLFPEGASTKNAGFACFGSLTEIASDLQTHPPEDVVELIQQRWEGLKLLRMLGDREIGFKQHGGYEIFDKTDELSYILDQCEKVNELLKPLFPSPVFSVVKNNFGFANIQQQLVYNPFEGQIDTGKMMRALLKKAYALGISILNNCSVIEFDDVGDKVMVKTSLNEFQCRKLCLATNGFAGQFLNDEVQPARAQVLITEPIKNLKIKGTFHLDQGFYYFRNIEERILLGGGRNLDFKQEETTEFGLTATVQNELERLLRQVIFPEKEIVIAHRWSGIMGVGHQKKPVVKALSDHIFCGVRLGGMGIAIGAKTAKELVNIVLAD